MTEDRTPTGQHDAPRESTFGRLCAALVAEYARQAGAGILSHAAVIRAVLTELRTVAAEWPHGIVTAPGPLTREQRDALRKRWAEMNYERPIVRAESVIPGATYEAIPPRPAAFIDAILAEAGGSGGT